ncbi:MAG: phytanoyl-CoA dioxygenase family protein [Acidimicrobiales bacterium]|nr:phytanoyl-CoA dioxygenase family protein [Actinomycetota bacterium]
MTSPAPLDHAASTADLLAEADRLAGAGRALEAVDLLHAANVARRDPELEVRLAVLRHQAFGELPTEPGLAEWPLTSDPGESAHIPMIAPSELTADAVRRAITAHGSAYVPGLIDAETVRAFVEGIDHVLALRKEMEGRPLEDHESWLVSLPLPQEQAATLARKWVAGDGGALMCDSPRLLDLVFATYERVGLKRLLTDYLGERPVLSANKGTLRRARVEGKTDWHQDGNFLGRDLRALNVWVTLTDCGVDAPTMDLVPKRFDTIVESGTGGAIFDWAVGPDTVAELAADAPPVRPVFKAGDCMLFDDLCLHRTALAPEFVNTRHALESWFFAPSAYPAGQVPLVW